MRSKKYKVIKKLNKNNCNKHSYMYVSKWNFDCRKISNVLNITECLFCVFYLNFLQ